MEIAFLVGRIMVGVYFILNSYNHLVNGSHMHGYAASKGVPAPKIAIFGSGLLLLLGGLSVMLGIFVVWGIIALLLFLVPVTFVMHNYWAISDPAEKMNEKIEFRKNLALVGFLLMSLAIPEPWPYSSL